MEDLANFIKDNGSSHVDILAVAAEKDAAGGDTIMTDIPESMAKAAPAATEAASAASGVAGKVADAVKGAAEVVQTFIADSDIDTEHHDEL